MVCRIPGESEKEILVTAHLDQASTTVQGADNDGSGIAILLHLAEIFAAEKDRSYTLTFVATDAEEYGMIGAQRYIETHPNTENIIAGISLDNLGRNYYDGMNMELIGQYRNYGPIWLALTAQETAAQTDGITWEVNLRAPFDQVTDQAAPVSFMDQGPVVAAGVPSLGFTGHVPAEFSDLHYHLWHGPDDTLEHQSAELLGQSGLIAEALIRQLLSMESFPQEFGRYLYFDDTQQVLRGAPLWAIFAGFIGLFFLGSIWVDRSPLSEKLRGWRNVLPHFLGLWLPLLASIILLYGFVAVGLMKAYHTYPATTKDPDLLHPRWPAVILFLVGLSLFLFLGRYFVRQYASHWAEPEHQQIMPGHEHRRDDGEVLGHVVGDRERGERAAGDEQLLADLDDLDELRRVGVEVDHVPGLLGRLGAGVHGHADVGLGEGGGVVGAVAGHGDEAPAGLLARGSGPSCPRAWPRPGSRRRRPRRRWPRR